MCPLTTFFDAWSPRILSVFRFVFGLLIFTYGMAKTFKIPYVEMFANIPPLIQTAGVIELVGGFLVMIGLLTRPAAFLLSGQMAFAYFIGHGIPQGHVLLPILNGGVNSVLFCFAFLYLAATGGGVWSVDALRACKSQK
ncbi:MAG: DoxX family protein [Burkholderiales bacterium]|jgi:putative oxidoreductase|nr:DoxX family protein [Burkholderiales bacterium]